MARLRKEIVGDSEDELPELSELLVTSSVVDVSSRHPQQAENERRSRSGSQGSDDSHVSRDVWQTNDQHKLPSLSARSRSPLKTVTANAIRLPLSQDIYHSERKISAEIPLATRQCTNFRASPIRSAKKLVDYRVPSSGLTDIETSEDEEEAFTDLSGFIVSDAESVRSDDELVKPTPARTPRRLQRGLRDKMTFDEGNVVPPLPAQIAVPEVVDLILPSPRRYVSDSQKSSDDSAFDISKQNEGRNHNVDDSEEEPAILKFSPTRHKTPRRLPLEPAPSTPPTSPSKTRLQSPSKRNRIPPTPHRPSIDAYWNAEIINTWNETHSPVKTPRTARKCPIILSDDSDSDSLTPLSPKKSPSKSPTKQARAETIARKIFDKEKQDLASAFLLKIDTALTENRVSALATSTGGVKILWSKKLNTTAGRANWRREIIRNGFPASAISGPSGKTTTHHHATIELATKVISSSTQLLNVLAHEYCHLCVFMLDGVKDRPHGKEFKTWAAKATMLFKDRGVEVTTKHSFEIQYKYAWECQAEGCGILYERHSKSIDIEKMGCGRCRGKLVQMRPTPRGGGTWQNTRGGLDDLETERKSGDKAQEGKKRSEYQHYVKNEYDRVKRGHPGISFGEIMKVLGAEFREKKKNMVDGKRVGGGQDVGDGLAGALDGLEI